jgi:hypothetical protein
VSFSSRVNWASNVFALVLERLEESALMPVFTMFALPMQILPPAKTFFARSVGAIAI